VLTPVADGVFVHRSELLRNLTVVVRGRAGALVVDPGITATELACLGDDLRASGQPVVAGFATHPDWDHELWAAALGDAPHSAPPAARRP
jgi:glyoxylase-like metal-dependent hydrolase (beta-lactamase superfamily II)